MKVVILEDVPIHRKQIIDAVIKYLCTNGIKFKHYKTANEIHFLDHTLIVIGCSHTDGLRCDVVYSIHNDSKYKETEHALTCRDGNKIKADSINELLFLLCGGDKSNVKANSTPQGM